MSERVISQLNLDSPGWIFGIVAMFSTQGQNIGVGCRSWYKKPITDLFDKIKMSELDFQRNIYRNCCPTIRDEGFQLAFLLSFLPC
jgi:hypothetical protein